MRKSYCGVTFKILVKRKKELVTKKMETIITDNNNISTQVNFDLDYYTLLIDDLKSRNQMLEELHYNTRFNSGRRVPDENYNEGSELLSLRNEFKSMLSKIKKNEQITDKKDRSCCCRIL